LPRRKRKTGSGIFLSRYPEVQREIFGRDTKGEKGGEMNSVMYLNEKWREMCANQKRWERTALPLIYRERDHHTVITNLPRAIALGSPTILIAYTDRNQKRPVYAVRTQEDYVPLLGTYFGQESNLYFGIPSYHVPREFFGTTIAAIAYQCAEPTDQERVADRHYWLEPKGEPIIMKKTQFMKNWVDEEIHRIGWNIWCDSGLWVAERTTPNGEKFRFTLDLDKGSIIDVNAAWERLAFPEIREMLSVCD